MSVVEASAIPLSQQYLARKRELAGEMLARTGDGVAGAPGAKWARKVTGAARARFLEIGAPIRRDEYWRFTDPGPVTRPPDGDAIAEAADPDVFDSVDAIRVSLKGSEFRVESELPEGIEIESLRAVCASDGHWARESLGRLEAAGQTPVARPLAALNSALIGEGLVIRASAPVERPVLFSQDAGAQGGVAYGRVLVRVESGARLLLLEQEQSPHARNSVLEADLADNSRLDHIRAQIADGRIETTASFVRLGAGANFRGFALSTDGELTRNETVLTLAGEAARGHVAGGVLGRARSVSDNTIFVTHAAPGCESRQVFKSVLDDRARSVFQGKVLVRDVAQQTDGYQISQAVLLDQRSEFDSKPELEIYADDVKCSHGSTAGALDESALFYLRARGVTRRESESLLVAAFLEEAIAEIGHEAVADRIRELSARWMARRERGESE